MRNIIKNLNVTTYDVLVYNTETKKEEKLRINKTEVEEKLALPPNCYLISKNVFSEEIIKYRLTMQEFVKHATIID